MRAINITVLTFCGTLLFAGHVLAQGSTGAPAGTEPATAPGGTQGIAGPANEAMAIRDGAAVPATPGTGIDVRTGGPAMPVPTEQPVSPPATRP
jgi:hypothetical protein